MGRWFANSAHSRRSATNEPEAVAPQPVGGRGKDPPMNVVVVAALARASDRIGWWIGRADRPEAPA